MQFAMRLPFAMQLPCFFPERGVEARGEAERRGIGSCAKHTVAAERGGIGSHRRRRVSRHRILRQRHPLGVRWWWPCTIVFACSG